MNFPTRKKPSPFSSVDEYTLWEKGIPADRPFPARRKIMPIFDENEEEDDFDENEEDEDRPFDA